MTARKKAVKAEPVKEELTKLDLVVNAIYSLVIPSEVSASEKEYAARVRSYENYYSVKITHFRASVAIRDMYSGKLMAKGNIQTVSDTYAYGVCVPFEWLRDNKGNGVKTPKMFNLTVTVKEGKKVK